jgi:hypothetical protein
LTNSEKGKTESDFIKKIEDVTSDEEFVIKMENIPDCSLIIPK